MLGCANYYYCFLTYGPWLPLAPCFDFCQVKELSSWFPNHAPPLVLGFATCGFCIEDQGD